MRDTPAGSCRAARPMSGSISSANRPTSFAKRQRLLEAALRPNGRRAWRGYRWPRSCRCRTRLPRAAMPSCSARSDTAGRCAPAALDARECGAHARLARVCIAEAPISSRLASTLVAVEHADVAVECRDCSRASRSSRAIALRAALETAPAISCDAPSPQSASRRVERSPAHDFGEGVVPRRAADLPDAVVRLAPHARRRPRRSRAASALRPLRACPPPDELARGVTDRAIDVELHLLVGAVADAHGSGVREAAPDARARCSASASGRRRRTAPAARGQVRRVACSSQSKNAARLLEVAESR